MTEIKAFLGNRIIAFHPILSKITQSINAGLLLGQIAYWWYNSGERGFYKTDTEFLAEFGGMGLKEFKNAKTKLKELGLIKILKKDTPPISFYVFNVEILKKMITEYKTETKQLDQNGSINQTETDFLISPKGTNQLDRNGLIGDSNTDIHSNTDIYNNNNNNIYNNNIYNNNIYNNNIKENKNNIGIKEKEKSIREEKEIIDLWTKQSNLQKIHKPLKYENAIKTTLKIYTFLEIKQSILNYSYVINHPELYFWTYKWNLKDFLKRGIDRFIDTANPLDNFKKRGSPPVPSYHSRYGETSSYSSSVSSPFPPPSTSPPDIKKIKEIMEDLKAKYPIFRIKGKTNE